MDFLGSILGNMSGPPTMSEKEKERRKKERELKAKYEENLKKETKMMRDKTESRINKFLSETTGQKKITFPPMAKHHRSIVHDVAEVAGLVAYSFGEEDVDRYTIVWKKEFQPSDEELQCLRRGEKWDPEAAAKNKEEAERLAKMEEEERAEAKKNKEKFIPKKENYHSKYEHLIGKDVAVDGAKSTAAVKTSFGMVSAESKKDRRTVEDIQAELRAKKRQRLEQGATAAAPEGEDDDGDKDERKVAKIV